MEIGNMIKKIRVAQKLSQSDLSKLANLSPSYLSKVENGYQIPSINTLEVLSKALNTDLIINLAASNDLLSFENEKAIYNKANNAINDLLLSSGITSTNEINKPVSESSIVPKVFIPYSHEDEKHKLWVKKLSDELMRKGVDVIVDIYDTKAGSNIIYWMQKSISKAKYVIPIYTPTYCEKAMSGKGGVGFEHTIITQELFNSINENEKIIPIIRKGDSESSIPPFARPLLHIDFRNDTEFETKLVELLRILHNEPKYIKPKIGENPFKSLKHEHK